jgi:large subunit ribosomal protein L23
MDLSIYDIIIGPVISDKAYKLNKLFKKLALKVHPKANKPMVKEALEKLFSVKVDKVSIVVRKGKTRRMRGGKETTGKLSKRAIVTLADGYSLDFIDQAGTNVASAQASKKE